MADQVLGDGGGVLPGRRSWVAPAVGYVRVMTEEEDGVEGLICDNFVNTWFCLQIYQCAGISTLISGRREY